MQPLLQFTNLLSNFDRTFFQLFWRNLYFHKTIAMKTLFFVFSLFPAGLFTAYCQEGMASENFVFGEWPKDSERETAIVFSDICNVRREPDARSEIVGKLTIDTDVKILKITDTELKLNGITSPWIRISADTLTGYVWGGTLTSERLKLADGRSLLWGLTEVKMVDGSEAPHISLRVAENGAVQTKADFVSQYGDRMNGGTITVYPAPQLEGIEHLIIYEIPAFACGVYASIHYFLYSEGQLPTVGDGYAMGDGGVLHESLTYTFPYPPSEPELRDYHYVAEEGHILRIENAGGYDDDCIWVETTKAADFTWDGTSLVKACNE